MMLTQHKWAIVYFSHDEDYATNLRAAMNEAKHCFYIYLNEPLWVEIPTTKPQDFIAGIKA